MGKKFIMRNLDDLDDIDEFLRALKRTKREYNFGGKIILKWTPDQFEILEKFLLATLMDCKKDKDGFEYFGIVHQYE